MIMIVVHVTNFPHVYMYLPLPDNHQHLDLCTLGVTLFSLPNYTNLQLRNV